MIPINKITSVINIIVVIQCFFSYFEGVSQKKYRPKTNMNFSTVSLGTGSSHFYGDVGSLQNIKSVRWNISCSYTHTLSSKIHIGISASFIRLSGDDFYANNDMEFIRNLHFRNDLKQIATFIEYHPLDYTTDFRKRLNLSPYVLIGIGYYSHNPLAKFPLNLGSEQWTNLEPYHTEGQGINTIYPEPYKLSGITIPSGIGLRYQYKENIDFSFEVIYHTVFTDYLDDVSGIYPNTGLFTNQIGVALSNRSREPTAANIGVDRSPRIIKYLNDNNLPNIYPFNSSNSSFGAIGTNRGSIEGNDAYITTNIKIQFLIPNKKIKCPKIN
jgi:hypothetical protein